ncbi:MAG: hypothetical protein M1416_03240 [Candidatus Pacearchaeota archaeon]|nr:hypothetical protein [Candidatus Pacearchaeota archaeon]
MSLEKFADIELTRKQLISLGKKVLKRHYQEIKKKGEYKYNINDIQELFSIMPELDEETISQELSKIKYATPVNTTNSKMYSESMGEYNIGYEFNSPTNNNLCRIIGYKERKMIFKKCNCGKQMLEVHPLVQDQRTEKIYPIGKKVHYCSNCGTNYEIRDSYN